MIENDGKEFMKAFYNSIENDSLNNTRRVISKIMLNLNAIEEREEC